VTPPIDHPLMPVMRAAASGRFPPVDGRVEVMPPDESGTHAVVEFTGHSFVLTDRGPDDDLFAGVDAYGGATNPRFLTRLAGRRGWVGSLDLVMVRRVGAITATRLPICDDVVHPRVERALHHRHDVSVHGDERGIVTLGIGLAGRREMSIELTGASHGGGVGRELVEGALAHLDSDDFVFAQVAPGNAASVRMFLACRFVPIGSEVLIEPRD